MLGDRCITKQILLDKILYEIQEQEKRIQRLYVERDKITILLAELRNNGQSRTSDEYTRLYKQRDRYAGEMFRARVKIKNLKEQYKRYQQLDI